jgi:uncharacterized OsmC-like protein
VAEEHRIDVRARQEPLRARYREDPREAGITDGARTVGGAHLDPVHGRVRPGSVDHGIDWDFGIHRAVGGDHDLPNPGDILCAAVASCLDSTLRMIADRLGVTLTSLEVDVRADVDVRGTLVVDRAVPVGFQNMRCNVDIAAADGTDPKTVEKLVRAAEHSCVCLQTVRSGVPVETIVTGPDHMEGRAPGSGGLETVVPPR